MFACACVLKTDDNKANAFSHIVAFACVTKIIAFSQYFVDFVDVIKQMIFVATTITTNYTNLCISMLRIWLIAAGLIMKWNVVNVQITQVWIDRTGIVRCFNCMRSAIYFLEILCPCLWPVLFSLAIRCVVFSLQRKLLKFKLQMRERCVRTNVNLIWIIEILMQSFDLILAKCQMWWLKITKQLIDSAKYYQFEWPNQGPNTCIHVDNIYDMPLNYVRCPFRTGTSECIKG